MKSDQPFGRHCFKIIFHMGQWRRSKTNRKHIVATKKGTVASKSLLAMAFLPAQLCLVSRIYTQKLPIVFFLQGRLRQGATHRRAHGGSRRQICRSWATNLSSTCWGDRGTLIPAHEHRAEIIRQTPDNRSITNIIASGILDTNVCLGTF